MTQAPYKDEAAWLEERKTGLGGTDAAAVLGVSPYKTAVEVWREKTGKDTGEVPVNRLMLRGKALEPFAADMYAEETGRTLRRQPLRRHPEFDFMFANIDRQIMADADRSTGALEIKTAGLRNFSNIKAHGMPDHYIIQLMHYLFVANYSWGSFALFNSERWEMIHFDLEADETLIEQMVEVETEFWTYNVTGDIAPDPVAPAIDIPEIEGELTTIDDLEWRDAAEQFKEARELKVAATDLEANAAGRLKDLMTVQGVSAIEIPDLVRIYYREQDGRVSWKKTALALAVEASVDADDFKVLGDPTRSFRPYFLTPPEED